MDGGEWKKGSVVAHELLRALLVVQWFFPPHFSVVSCLLPRHYRRAKSATRSATIRVYTPKLTENSKHDKSTFSWQLGGKSGRPENFCTLDANDNLDVVKYDAVEIRKINDVYRKIFNKKIKKRARMMVNIGGSLNRFVNVINEKVLNRRQRRI